MIIIIAITYVSVLARLNITDELSKRTRNCFFNNSNIRAPIRGMSAAGCNAAELLALAVGQYQHSECARCCDLMSQADAPSTIT
jgi:hypothetical protein